jgi:uncharacterized protein YggU (UPF0235/DUF167 family)
MMSAEFGEDKDDGRTDVTRLSLRVQPRASRDEIVGWQGTTLRLRVTAPPVRGAANTAVRTALATALGVRLRRSAWCAPWGGEPRSSR